MRRFHLLLLVLSFAVVVYNENNERYYVYILKRLCNILVENGKNKEVKKKCIYALIK